MIEQEKVDEFLPFSVQYCSSVLINKFLAHFPCQQAVVNEDATGSITALQAEIRRLRDELEKARGDCTNVLEVECDCTPLAINVRSVRLECGIFALTTRVFLVTFNFLIYERETIRK